MIWLDVTSSWNQTIVELYISNDLSWINRFEYSFRETSINGSTRNSVFAKFDLNRFIYFQQIVHGSTLIVFTTLLYSIITRLDLNWTHQTSLIERGRIYANWSIFQFKMRRSMAAPISLLINWTLLMRSFAQKIYVLRA